jgi:hypothetical protein
VWTTVGLIPVVSVAVTVVLLAQRQTVLSMRVTKIVKLVTLAGFCTIVLAACGSSARPTTLVKSASTGISAAVRFSKLHAFARCVRLPRPQRWRGPMGQQLARSGVNLNASAFQSAMNACKALAPAAKATVGPTFGQSKAMMVAFARCMRAHGLTSFPDPTVSSATRASQASQPSGADMSYSGPGGSVTLDIPQSLIQSPAFNKDSAACGMGTASGRKQKPAVQP